MCEGEISKVSFNHNAPDRLGIVTSSGYFCLVSSAGETFGEWKVASTEVSDLEFISPSNLIITVSIDGEIRIWDKSSMELTRPDAFLNSQSSHIRFEKVLTSNNGEEIATLTANGTLRLWDKKGDQKGNPIKDEVGAVKSMAFNPKSNNQLLIVGTNGKVFFFNTRTNTLEEVKDLQDIIIAKFSSDGERIIMADRSGNVFLQYIEGNQQSGQKLAPATDTRAKKIQWKVSSNKLTDLQFSPDSKFVVSGIDGSAIVFWDLRGRKVFEFEGNNFELALNGEHLVIAFMEKGQIPRVERIPSLDELLEESCKWLKDHLTVSPDEANPNCAMEQNEKRNSNFFSQTTQFIFF